MTMWSVVVFTIASLACFGVIVNTASIDCPTPTSPENGQIFFYQDGMTVKYACDPGFMLKGEVFSYCQGKEWSSEAPQCFPNDDSSALPSSKDAVGREKAIYSRPLFSWDPEDDNATAKNDSGMLQDEPRLHMVLYPERRRQQQARSPRIRTAAVRVQSATELEEEQKKRSQEEKPTVQPVAPSVIYVRKALTPGKVVIQDDSLRRQYELAALHLAGDPHPDVSVVSLPRAAVSTDDKGEQSDEALRQMYIMAQNYMYPRQAVADPNRSPVVLTLSESQIMWINSLHPELRERYLRDLYNTRAKEAEEGARAQEFLRRYEDAYHLLYNRPYYVRQPLAVMVEDPVASYDYSCYQADSRGRATLIRPPRIPNARVTFYKRKNSNSPYNDYLSAVYRCNPGFRMRDSRLDELHCSQRNWLGERPICDHTATAAPTPWAPVNSNPISCSVNNGGCAHTCFSHANGAFMRCGCVAGFHLAPDLRSCVRDSQQIRTCRVNNGGCEQTCLTHPNGEFVRCGCHRGFHLARDGRSCESIAKPNPTPNRRSCSVDNGGCSQICSTSEDGVSVECRCAKGFHLGPDGRTCLATQVPRCSVRNGGCSQICSTSESGDSVQCSCTEGFSLGPDDKTCLDVNECSQGNFGCSHKCVNTRGSAFCRCNTGFFLSSDRKACEDIDECAQERRHRCHHKCTNTPGSYKCSCLPGYLMLKNNTCVGCPKNSYMAAPGSCEECPPNSHTVSEGHALLQDCICNSGYIGNPGLGIICTDIDECEVENFGCSRDCVNTPGSAHCYCPVGYELDSDQKTCVDIDECAIKTGGCQLTCHNTEGSFYCSCPEGYTSSTADVYSCIDIDECLEQNGHCSHTCNNFPGGYYCSCDVGYRLDSSQKVCTAVSCSQIAVPHHAKLRCGLSGGSRNALPSSTTEFQYGTTCTFKCETGYKLSVLPGSITCDENGSWNGQKPECVALTCPAITAPVNGNVAPASCSSLGGEVLQKCYITCNPGYHLVGTPVFTCKRSLAWKPEEFPTCQAVRVLPHVDCLPDITIELPIGKSSMEVRILPPSSNMDPEYISISPSWVKNGNVTFPAGTTNIIYTALSPTAPNATSSCIRTVKVIDKEPPRAVDCPSPIFVDITADTDEDILIVWEEPTFQDNVGVVSVTKTMEPNVTLAPGVHLVKYIAKDSEGNVAECAFHINVTAAECIDPVGPEDGESNCLEWMFGKICEPTCHPGHVFYFSEPAFYTCGSSGTWSPNNRFQDCTKFVQAENLECLPGMELRIHDETEEEICVECPSDMVWWNGTKTCIYKDNALDEIPLT